MSPFLQPFLTNPFFQILLSSPLALVILDFITGTLSASKRQVFDGKKLSDFVKNDLLKWVICIVFSLIVSARWGNLLVTALASFATLAPVTYGSIISIIENACELLPVPLRQPVEQVVTDVSQFIPQVGPPLTTPIVPVTSTPSSADVITAIMPVVSPAIAIPAFDGIKPRA